MDVDRACESAHSTEPLELGRPVITIGMHDLGGLPPGINMLKPPDKGTRHSARSGLVRILHAVKVGKIDSWQDSSSYWKRHIGVTWAVAHESVARLMRAAVGGG